MSASVQSRLVASLVVCLLAAASARAADRPFVVAAQGDAFIAHQSGSDVWSIGSANLELVIGFDAARTLTCSACSTRPPAARWDITPAPAYQPSPPAASA